MLNPFKTNAATLADKLSAKGEELRARQAAQSNAADSFIDAAAQARAESELAATHAAAVEKAVVILDAAGVAL